MSASKHVFSIRDMENLSGIKAHTIRIWEKRYDLLQPSRSDNNIRYYDLDGLQLLMNVKLLHNHGYKISKIAKYPPHRIPQLVMEIVTDKSIQSHALNAFKLAMVNFDQTLFHQTYTALAATKPFRDIFNEVFIPMLNDTGILWQAGTVSPAHEHFICGLIRQKLTLNIDRLQRNAPEKDQTVYVLFLPVGESHEMGLMYLHYEILLESCKTIYLGPNVTTENLAQLCKRCEKIVFVSYFTLQPGEDQTIEYLKEFSQEVLSNHNSQLWATGPVTKNLQKEQLPEAVHIFNSLPEFNALMAHQQWENPKENNRAN